MDGHGEESVIIPMNPKGSYSGGSTPGSIIAQKWFADREGKVIISFDRPCRYANSLEKPHLGFFRDTSKGDVTHRFSIIDVTDDWGVTKYVENSIPPWSNKFLPPWRRELYDDAREEPIKRRTWMLISNIYELKEPKNLEYFGKKHSQSFVYSTKGLELAYSEEKPDPDRFIDDVIFRCARTHRLTEDDLELIIWAWLVKNNVEYVERQRKIEGKSLRLDLLTKFKGEYVVMELKRDTATMETLVNQLRPYIRGVMNRFGLTKLRGIIIARDKNPDLEKELSKAENEDIKFLPYMFSFILGDIEQLF